MDGEQSPRFSQLVQFDERKAQSLLGVAFPALVPPNEETNVTAVEAQLVVEAVTPLQFSSSLWAPTPGLSVCEPVSARVSNTRADRWPTCGCRA